MSVLLLWMGSGCVVNYCEVYPEQCVSDDEATSTETGTDGTTGGTDTNTTETGTTETGTTETGTTETGTMETGTDTMDTTDTSDTGGPCTNDAPTLCGDTCTNTMTHADNCGSCGNICNGTCVNSDCLRKRFIFVTKQAYSGDLNGIAGATELCQAAAVGAQLGGEYAPWLSTLSNYPDKNIMDKDGYFVRPDGEVVAESWADLIDGQLNVPINVFEDGTSPAEMGDCMAATQAWTSTNTEGGFNLQLNISCSGWSTILGNGGYGNIHATDSAWTQSGGCLPAQCNGQRHLYCVEL